MNKSCIFHSRSLFVLLVFLCCLYSCEGKKKGRPQAIGIGLLTINTQYPVPLYRNQTDELPFDTLKFKTDRSGKTLFISGVELAPYLKSAGDSDNEGKEHLKMGLVRFGPELKFCVLDTGDSYFRVIGNEVSMEEFVIRKEPKAVYYSEERMVSDHNCSNCPGSKYNPRWYVFETWERYLKRVEYITKDSLAIYDLPAGKILYENNDRTFLPFSVTNVKGDWIKVQKGLGRESNFDTGRNYKGWIRWRKGTDLLIGITERTYD